MGRNLSQAAAEAFATTSITAGEAIAKGDLVTMSTDKKGYYAIDPSSVGSQLRPIFQPQTSNLAVGLPKVTLDAGPIPNQGYTPEMLCLPTAAGNILCVWLSNTTTASLQVVTPLGEIVVAKKTIATSVAAINSFNLIKLTGGNYVFALTEWNGTNSLTKAVVFNDAGTITQAQTTLQTIASSGVSHIKMAALSTGNFALVNAHGVAIVVSVWSPSLVQSGANYSPGGAHLPRVAATQATFEVVATASGNVFYVCYATTANFNVALTMNNAGTYNSVASLQITTSAGLDHCSLIVTPADKIFGLVYNASGAFIINTLASATNFATSSIGLPSNVTQGNGFGILSFGGNGYIFFCGAAGLVMLRCESANHSYTATHVIQAGMTTGRVQAMLMSNGNIGVAVNNETNIFFYEVTTAGTVVNASVQVLTGVPASQSGVKMFPATAGQNKLVSFVTSIAAVPTLGLVLTETAKQVPLGIALEAAAKDALVKVQVSGEAATRLTFSPTAFNANQVGGQDARLIGNLALMNGLERAKDSNVLAQPSGPFGFGRVAFITKSGSFKVPASSLRVRVFGCSGDVAATSFGAHVSATGGHLTSGVPGVGIGGEINNTGGAGANGNGGGVANYFGDGKTANATTPSVGLFGVNDESLPPSVDYIGTGANGRNGGGGQYNASVVQGGGFPGGAPGLTTTGVAPSGGGFAMRTLNNLTVDSVITCTVAAGGVGCNAGLIIVEY